MGRTPGKVEIDGKTFETFTWEKLDLVNDFQKAFQLQVENALA
jgi:S-adenosylmethionine synthetase